MELCEFILTTKYFLFRGNIYKQKFGTATVSPIVVETGSIKFTHEEESNRSIPFLDTLIARKQDGTVNVIEKQ